MKKLLLTFFLFLLCCPSAHAVTTWYACTSGGNWSANVWTSVSADQGTCVASLGTPVAGDTAILNSSSGNITLTATAAAATLTMTGYTGVLALSTKVLTLTTGLTGSASGGTITASTGGGITLNGSQTFTTNGMTIPNLTSANSNETLTLGSALTITGTLTTSSPSGFTLTTAGAYNMQAASWVQTNGTLKIVSGQTFTVTTSTTVTGGSLLATSTSNAFISFTGTQGNAEFVGLAATWMDAAGSTGGVINDYFAGALSNTTDVMSRTDASFATVYPQGYAY